MKVSLEEVKKKGMLSEYSPIVLLAEKLQLKYLLREGEYFSGPAVGLAILVDKITKLLPIKTVLDLFCGTGAISKIALKNGVESIDCVDTYIEAAKENLAEFSGKVNFINDDVFKLKLDKTYDLIVADPPREIIPKFLKLNFNTHLFVIWHGNVEDEEWNLFVREKLRKKFKKVLEVSEYGEEMSCCSSSSKGIEWIEKLFAEWR